MKKRIIFGVLIFIACVAALVSVAAKMGRADAKPAHVVLTADQCKPLAEIVEQLKQLDQQSAVLRGKAAGIVQVYQDQAGLSGKQVQLNQIPGGGFAIDEVTPQAEPNK